MKIRRLGRGGCRSSSQADDKNQYKYKTNDKSADTVEKTPRHTGSEHFALLRNDTVYSKRTIDVVPAIAGGTLLSLGSAV
jgi:hypothetical protein